jgi:hypothetical protein
VSGWVLILTVLRESFALTRRLLSARLVAASVRAARIDRRDLGERRYRGEGEERRKEQRKKTRVHSDLDFPRPKTVGRRPIISARAFHQRRRPWELETGPPIPELGVPGPGKHARVSLSVSGPTENWRYPASTEACKDVSRHKITAVVR